MFHSVHHVPTGVCVLCVRGRGEEGPVGRLGGVAERECEALRAHTYVHTYTHAPTHIRTPKGEIAAAINEGGVHISINLDGWTSMGRTNEIFALTPAPVQV